MNSKPNITGLKLALAGAAIFVFSFLLIRFYGSLPTSTSTPPPPRERGSPERPPAPVQQPGNQFRQRLQGTVETLRASPGSPDARQILAGPGESLLKLPPPTAISVIQGFLQSGTDAPTGLEFEVDADGFLTTSPSLRVFLLDQLAKVDRRAAADYAKQLLLTFTSPDEWAVCLRNVAWANGSGETRAFLEERMEQMLRHEPWQQNPSAGFLEAFDVAVYVGGTKLIPALSDLVQRTDNPGVTHAAYLALDRLTIRDPATTLAALQGTPELMRGREATRANYFARADVREVGQRQVLKRYPLSSERTGAELQTFAGLYPNANFTVSHNLLTKVQTPGHAELLSRDAEALRVAQEWLADAQFERLKPHLETIRNRLEVFLEQERTGR